MAGWHGVRFEWREDGVRMGMVTGNELHKWCCSNKYLEGNWELDIPLQREGENYIVEGMKTMKTPVVGGLELKVSM